MKNSKKGDTYSALIILVIGVSIIMYILMLPPEDRAKLLEENTTGTAIGKYRLVETLLQQQPGVLDYLPRTTAEIGLPSFTISTKKEGEVLASFDSVYLKKSLFNEEKKNVTFTVGNMGLTDNIMLSFSSKQHTGRLAITLNGETLMNKELTTDSPAPIQLPKSLLKDRNVLTFETSGPGVEFWKSNEVTLENVKITADVTDISGQENKQFFTITDQQKKLLISGTLAFVSECAQRETIPLEVYLNKKIIFSGIPECGVKTEIKDIDKEKLLDGENNLWFRSIGGNYLVYNAKVTMKLTEPLYPTYYFDLGADRLYNVRNRTADVNLTILFPNSVDYKQGVVYINDGKIEIDTRNSYYSRNINSYMRDGTNAVQVRPLRDKLEVAEVRVVYAEI